MISLGGQAPHVLRAHVGRTSGEADEVELTPVGMKLNSLIVARTVFGEESAVGRACHWNACAHTERPPCRGHARSTARSPTCVCEGEKGRGREAGEAGRPGERLVNQHVHAAVVSAVQLALTAYTHKHTHTHRCRVWTRMRGDSSVGRTFRRIDAEVEEEWGAGRVRNPGAFSSLPGTKRARPHARARAPVRFPAAHAGGGGPARKTTLGAAVEEEHVVFGLAVIFQQDVTHVAAVVPAEGGKITRAWRSIRFRFAPRACAPCGPATRVWCLTA